MASTWRPDVFGFIIASLVFTSSSRDSEGRIRLAGLGANRCSGRVEIFHSSTWGTVCDDRWDMNDAAVVCRELSCGAALGAPQSALFGEGSGQIWLNSVTCAGNERSVTECQHDGFVNHRCDHAEDAGVICTGVPVRLAGDDHLSGRVEIYYNNTWGRVCVNGWDIDDAGVVCRELGYGAALDASHWARSGDGSEQIWLDDVSCSGSERSLSECRHGGLGKHSCSEDAAVVCSGVPVRFIGPTLCSGRVEMYNGSWGTVCDGGWDSNDARVLCGESGCGTLRKELKLFNKISGRASVDYVNCSGSERSLSQCRYGTSGKHDCVPAGVTCAAIPPKPRIHIHPDSAVTRGQNISITCSIFTPTQQLLHGTFTLTQTSGSFTRNQTTSTNSASFSIDRVNSDHDGLYNCLYYQNLQTRVLSDTISLSVTSEVSLWLLLSSVAAGVFLLLLVLILCLVHRRRRRARPPEPLLLNPIYVRNTDEDKEEEEEEEEKDYVNIELVHMNKQVEESHDYEDVMKTEGPDAEREETRDDESVYVNVTVDTYGADERLYNNL